MGARQTLFTRPWVPEIHYLYNRDLGWCSSTSWCTPSRASGTIRCCTFPMRFGVVPQMATVEGLAVALTDPGGRIPGDGVARAAQPSAGIFAQLFAPLGFLSRLW